LSLDLVMQALKFQIARDALREDMRIRGERVHRFRRYADGDHDANLTNEMRRLLRVKSAPEGSAEFADNYQDIIIQTMVDRLTLSGIEADNDLATDWAKEVMAFNRLDAMQGDVHEGAIRDADTFIMVSYDNEKQQVRFTHELAYDGTSGVYPVYLSEDVSEMQCAIKIWHITNADGAVKDQLRVNYYYPDRIEKRVSNDGQALIPFKDDSTDAKGDIPWTDTDGTPLGIPIVHYRNRGRKNWGLSEIENTIPLQNVQNRLLYSLVMAAELTAFQIRWAKGFTPPADLTPGMWVVMTKNGGPLGKNDLADVGVMEQGELLPYLDALRWNAMEMGKISRTPAPEMMGADDSSGEALKQREIGLIGKVERFQIKAGNSWEDVFGLAHKIQTEFGSKKPPTYERFYAQWDDAEVRNDKVTIENAMLLRPLIGDEEVLRIIAPIYEYDEDRIQKILKAADEKKQADMEAAMAAMPTFGGRTMPARNGAPPVPPNGAGQAQKVAV